MTEFCGIFGILLAAIGFLNTSVSAQTEKEFLIVADKTAACASGGAETSGSCLQVKRIYEGKFAALNGEIENFQFIPGYFYLLEVSFSKNVGSSAAADSAKTKYRLEKILTRIKSGDSSLAAQPEFSGTEWVLSVIEGNAIKNSKAFIKFEADRNSVVGNGGCNSFTGSLTKKGSQIKIPEIFATKVFCPDTSLTEIKFFNNLMDRVTRYEIAGEKLKLFAEDKVVLEFTAKK